MVFTAAETIDIENLKHSHELQILEVRDKFAQNEHGRKMNELELERQISSVRNITDPRLIEALTLISSSIVDLRIMFKQDPIKVMNWK